MIIYETLIFYDGVVALSGLLIMLAVIVKQISNIGFVVKH